MASILDIPTWFLTTRIGLDFLFALVTLMVSHNAFKIYALSKRREVKLLSTGFFFISTSYIIQTFFGIMILTKLNQGICDFWEIQSVATINLMTIILHILFFSIGTVTLVYMTFRKKNLKLYFLLLGISLLALSSSKNIILTFHMLTTAFFLYLVLHYHEMIKKLKKQKVLIIFIVFTLLFLSSIDFILSRFHDGFFITGHILEFGAYLLILVNLIQTNKK